VIRAQVAVTVFGFQSRRWRGWKKLCASLARFGASALKSILI
jgi:hypothetical protein